MMKKNYDFSKAVPNPYAKGLTQQCPCCDYFTLPERGGYDICPVCFWEDDGLDVGGLDRHSGPNHLTLREARKNFAEFGACDRKFLPNVVSGEGRARYRRVERAP